MILSFMLQTVITCENGVLIQKQCWDGKESTITREVKDGRMVTVSIEISNDYFLMQIGPKVSIIFLPF